MALTLYGRGRLTTCLRLATITLREVLLEQVVGPWYVTYIWLGVLLSWQLDSHAFFKWLVSYLFIGWSIVVLSINSTIRLIN